MPPRRPHDAQALLRRLDPELAGADLTELGEGWDYVAYAVDGRLLLKVAKETDPQLRAEGTLRDVATLDLAGRVSTLRTNSVLAHDTEEGALLLTLVPGPTADLTPPTDVGALGRSLAAFLTRLHTVPPVAAALVVGPAATAQAMHEETLRSWESAPADLEPADADLVASVLVGPVPAPPRHTVLLHHDLWPWHLTMRADGRDVTGVLDWGDACLGDPARDLGVLWLGFGTELVDVVLRTYAGPRDPDLRDRARWHGARAGVEDLLGRDGDRTGLATAVARLRAVAG